MASLVGRTAEIFDCPLCDSFSTLIIITTTFGTEINVENNTATFVSDTVIEMDHVKKHMEVKHGIRSES